MKTIFTAIAALLSFYATGQIITTVAGNGLAGYNGDSIAAISARLNSPNDVTCNLSGTIYIADAFNNRIRRVDTSGMITTIAMFYHPTGIVTDVQGSIYVSSGGDHRIYKINPNLDIDTIAGTGIDSFSGDGGAAINASLNSPCGISLDKNGNIYFADHENSRIRKIDPAGHITTVAGSDSAGYAGDGGLAINARLYGPVDVVVDHQGNLYISDFFNHRVRKVDTAGIIHTIAGTGPTGPSAPGFFCGDGGSAINACLNNPWGLTMDGAGNLFVADCINSRIRKIDTTGIITTIAGTGNNGYNGDSTLATQADLFFPRGIDMDKNGNLYIADNVNERIRKVAGIGSTTSISANIISKGLKVYPNPATNYIIIECNEAGKFALRDLLGKEHMNILLGGKGSKAIDVSNLTPGIYMYGYETKKYRETGRLIKL